MKLIHLKNLKHECVLVELARYVAHFEYACGSDSIYLQWHDGQIDEFEGCIGEHGQIKLSDNPRDSFKRLGKFTDLKEEDFERVVHKSGNIYADYKDWSFSEKLYSYFNARESFISSIEAEGYTLTNQVGIYQAKNTSESEKLKQIDSQMVWQAAQKKVINLSNCYLFVKS